MSKAHSPKTPIVQNVFARFVPIQNRQSISSWKKLKSKVRSLSEKALLTHWYLGPLIPASVRGLTHVLMIVDEYSDFKIVRSEAVETFQKIIAEHRTPRVLISDIGKMLTSRYLKRYCVENKTNKKLQCPKLAREIGIFKRASRTIVEMTRSLLHQAKLLKTFCLRPIGSACCLNNRVGTKKECKNSFEKHTGKSLEERN